MELTLWLCIAAIAASILIGWKFKINIGIIAGSFAFLIGCLIMGKSANAVIGYWPSAIAFFFIAVALFYGYAMQNGTIVQLGKLLLYKMQGKTALMPWIVWLLTGLIAFMGASRAATAFIGPIAFSIAMVANINPLIMAVAIGTGTLLGGDNPWTGAGVTMGALVQDGGFTDSWFEIVSYTWINSLLKQFLIMLLVYVVFKGYKANAKTTGADHMEKPEPMNEVQKKTLALIVISFLVIVIPSLLSTWFIKTPAMRAISNLCQPQSIFLIFALIARIMNLGDETKVIKEVPFNTIMMIVGVTMLMGVAQDAGLTTVMGAWMSESIPEWLIPGVLVLLASVLSFFSNGTTVVCPLLYPLVPGLAAAMNLNPVMCYSCVFVGAMATSLSPFSTGGSMIVAAAPEEYRDELTVKLIPTAFATFALCFVMAELGLFNIFHI